MGNVCDIVGKGTLVCQGTSSSTCQIYDSDNDGVPDNQDVCPGINDNATFTYNGSHLQYAGKTYKNIDNMDQDGFINCIDECVDDLPQDDPSFGLDSISDIKIRGAGCEPTPIGGFDGNQGTFTPTLTNTFTNTSTETNTQTSTPINTNTNTLTETYADTPTSIDIN